MGKAGAGTGGGLRVMVVGAHPDDCEFRCGGTAAKWAARGDSVCFVSMTNGQSGHHELGAAQLVQRRAAEARAAAGVIGIESRILPIPDGYLEPRLEYRLMLIRLIREYRADLVITNRPNDYHPDHRYTAQLVQDSAFSLTVPQIAPEVPALRKNPVMLYWWDAFVKPTAFVPDVVVSIDDVLEKKVAMLHQHASQVYEWLPWLAGILDTVPKEERARRAWLTQWYGAQSPVAESCRQQLIAKYGVSRGGAVQHAEAFEICEYGARPEETVLEGMFPG